jgi:hypothetical protein
MCVIFIRLESNAKDVDLLTSKIESLTVSPRMVSCIDPLTQLQGTCQPILVALAQLQYC